MTPEQEKTVEYVTHFLKEYLPDPSWSLEVVSTADAVSDIRDAMLFKSDRVMAPVWKIPVHVPDSKECEKWVDLAPADPVIWAACTEICHDLIRAGVPLPISLADFASKVLTGTLVAPDFGGANSPYYKFARDSKVCWAISQLKDAGVPVKSDSKSGRETACSIVAPLVNISPGGVWQIWRRYKKHWDRVKNEGPFYMENTGEVEYLNPKGKT